MDGGWQHAMQGQFPEDIKNPPKIFCPAKLKNERVVDLGSRHQPHSRLGHHPKVGLAEESLQVGAYTPLMRMPCLRPWRAAAGMDDLS